MIVRHLPGLLPREQQHPDGPQVVIARTVKGKGVSFMEGQAAWHGKPISDEDYRRALAELTERGS